MLQENLSNREKLVEEGGKLFENGDYKEALSVYNKVLNREPNNVDALNGKGITLLMLKEYGRALKTFDKILRIDPDCYRGLYNKGLIFYELRKYEKAIETFDEAISKKQDYANAWNAKGSSFHELGKHKNALEAFERIMELNQDDVVSCTNAGEIYFLVGDLDSACIKADEALRREEESTDALVLKGKIEIEKKYYSLASEYFRRAISSNIENPTPLLWDAYAKYLEAECTLPTEDENLPEMTYGIQKNPKYKELMFAIIGELERANKLCKKKTDKKLKACILYFLGIFYYMSKDTFTAKEKFEECVKLKSKSSTDEKARNLLNHIWDYAIRPPWWKWWLWSPINRWPRRIVFFFLLIPLFSLLFHPTIHEWVPFIKVDWTVSLIVLALSVFILLSPSIESIKTKEVDIKLRSPSLPFEPFLAPSMMEREIEEHEE
jgi:tetratricopeptide (TPR) repeat protein